MKIEQLLNHLNFMHVINDNLIDMVDDHNANNPYHQIDNIDDYQIYKCDNELSNALWKLRNSTYGHNNIWGPLSPGLLDTHYSSYGFNPYRSNILFSNKSNAYLLIPLCLNAFDHQNIKHLRIINAYLFGIEDFLDEYRNDELKKYNETILNNVLADYEAFNINLKNHTANELLYQMNPIKFEKFLFKMNRKVLDIIINEQQKTQQNTPEQIIEDNLPF